MCNTFILAVLFAFLAILVESTSFLLQLRGKRMTKWFGKSAFRIHVLLTAAFWMIAAFFVIKLQFEEQPIFHSNIVVSYFGLLLLVFGALLSAWAFKILGFKRTLGINFFEENIPQVEHGIYKHMKNPMDTGLVVLLFGLALFTGSVYNLIIALESILLMLPHARLENIPLGNIP